MSDEDEADEELEYYESYGLEVARIDGIPYAEWDGRWLPIDTTEDPPRPQRETLITATVDPGGGFMADDAHYELAKVDDTTLVHISQIDGIGTEVSLTAFVAGSEEDHIQAFIDELRDMESEAEVVGADDDDTDSDDGDRRLEFHRG